MMSRALKEVHTFSDDQVLRSFITVYLVGCTQFIQTLMSAPPSNSSRPVQRFVVETLADACPKATP